MNAALAVEVEGEHTALGLALVLGWKDAAQELEGALEVW